MPVIGFMNARSPEDTVQERNTFYKGLDEGGFVDRHNVTIEYRWARGDYARLPALAVRTCTATSECLGRDRWGCFGTRSSRPETIAKPPSRTHSSLRSYADV